MTPLIFLLLAIAGGLGAATRFLFDGLLRAKMKTAYPWATTIINVSGSLVLGFITGLTLTHLLPTDVNVVIGTGFLGGYTTFSTASYETVQLIKQGRYGWSLASGVGMLVLAVSAAGLGLWLASLI
ncbi:fluoride efflux transporter CrcB [Leifsonia sp. YAF41]|uniref:fluoride efflux transporter CrcB n=1 Tax=Leifsonia sp. YAF41 TaxID=3233086 RepID=UPI003F998137